MNRLIQFFILTIIFVGCSKAPLTNRKQLDLIGDNQLMASSFDSYDQVLKENKLSNDQEKVQMIKRVGNNIKNSVEKYLDQKGRSDLTEGFKWEFNLIVDDIVNAWCMPGGKVAFYTGILPICKNEAGVAVVMGHEVAHAVANHGGERMSQALVQQLGGVALGVALQQQPEQTQALAMAAYTGGSTLGILKFSRVQESEADRLGLTFMAMAGYNPETAPDFWQRMKAKGGGAPPEFLSTHPDYDTRISNLNKWMSEAKQYYSSSNKAQNSEIGEVTEKSDLNVNSKPKNVIQLKVKDN
ncbi:M48 family metallopeptidase [Marivirga atlantica]|jgi:predicted Zn-dependent protease|uniref:M48 family metallopeptidase n=1 Tax=Marivirga atlantica TaxID=1548457 RepID=A0A937AGI0_9BACT|nr:M48 family metallopeptidase [Marivirga atlantica]MBL0766336.1 M48 family metallopeptidase [Marivirga atlantica]